MIEVFFSYAHEDEKLRDELAKHLKLLQREEVIRAWYDREITAGTEWEGQIDEHLENAQIILLLVSADFLASDYCYDVELKRAMERHEAKEARVIPIILREVNWQRTLFGKLQALPKNALPVTNWQNPDQAFADIARGIHQIIESNKEMVIKNNGNVNSEKYDLEISKNKREMNITNNSKPNQSVDYSICVDSNIEQLNNNSFEESKSYTNTSSKTNNKKRINLEVEIITEETDIVDVLKILQKIQADLAHISQDSSVKISDIEKGSIRLILEGSKNGLEKLEAEFRNGNLKEISGIPIEDVSFINISNSDPKKIRLAFSIAGNINSDDLSKLKDKINKNQDDNKIPEQEINNLNKKDNISNRSVSNKNVFIGNIGDKIDVSSNSVAAILAMKNDNYKSLLPEFGTMFNSKKSESSFETQRDSAWHIAPNLFLSFKYAWAGVTYAFITQRNIRIFCTLSAVSVSIGVLVQLSPIQISIIILSCVVTLALLLLDTSLESVVDLTVGQSYHELAKIAKDCSAGAVLISGIGFIVIALYNIIPNLLHLL